MKRIASLLLGLAMAAAALSGCGAQGRETAAQEFPDAVSIVLSNDGIIVDGKAVSTDESAAVHTAHDIVCYESGRDFTYGEGTEADEHTAEEAEAHTVVHITQPGTYALSGTLSAGQIAVDLGEDAEDDPAAVVTLILNGVDITCTVAPAVIFYNVYECGSTDEDTASETVDTSAAGANVLIADGTINNVTGSYVARIYDPDSVVLSEDGMTVEDSGKLHKYDGAFYSKMSMNVDGGEAGTGVLNITADNEGLDTELHLTINGGTINITSGNDGINTNEDNVSVTTVNGGSVNIQVTGETGEGDGIDSNGWLVINGGAVTAAACSNSGDAGIDATMGITINGGTVAASGNMYDQIDGGAQNYVVFSFASRQNGGQTYTLQNADGETVGTWTPANDFTCLVVSSPDLTAGDYTLWQGTWAVRRLPRTWIPGRRRRARCRRTLAVKFRTIPLSARMGKWSLTVGNLPQAATAPAVERAARAPRACPRHSLCRMAGASLTGSHRRRQQKPLRRKDSGAGFPAPPAHIFFLMVLMAPFSSRLT